MKSDAERELKQIEKAIEEWERNRTADGGNDPDSSVPAPVKPKPHRNSGMVALPEPEEDDEAVRNQ